MRRLGRDRFRARDFDVNHFSVQVPGLPEAFRGYRIAQVSDIHFGHWITRQRWLGVVDLVNQQEPDVVALTGDFVSYAIHQIADDLAEGLAKLAPRDAKLAVLGNHDHWMDPLKMRQVLAQGGVIELENEVYTLRRGAAELHIAGVDDVIAGAPDLDRVLSQLPADGPALLLAHEPDFADTSAATGRFFMQLSGHSHGGQIVWPGLGPLLRGPMFYKYPLGAYQVGDMLQYTNRGIGTHVFRLRVNCPPEISVIELI
jgi:predicted MPP superfamily phosphohydrolase